MERKRKRVESKRPVINDDKNYGGSRKMECTEAKLDREFILNKSREILQSYNLIYNKTFEKQIVALKKEAKKIFTEKKKKLKKQNRKSGDAHDGSYYDKVQIEYEFVQLFNEFIVDKMYEVKQATYNIWKGIPAGNLENKSIEQFFNDINDLDLLIEVLHLAAIECDNDIPDVLVEKLYSFGEEAIDRVADAMLNETFILPYISKQDNNKSDISADISNNPADSKVKDSFLIPLEGIKILGGWKTEKAAQLIIDFLGRLNNINNQRELYKSDRNEKDKKFTEYDQDSEEYIDLDMDLFYEVAREALINIGKPSISLLIDTLEKAEKYYEYHEYLTMALAEIGENNKTEEIYKCLKKMFRKHDNKIVMADCLGQYGDGRAIPTLRGYIERNINDISKDILFTVNSVIEELGGSMEDILEDFYQKYN